MGCSYASGVFSYAIDDEMSLSTQWTSYLFYFTSFCRVVYGDCFSEDFSTLHSTLIQGTGTVFCSQLSYNLMSQFKLISHILSSSLYSQVKLLLGLWFRSMFCLQPDIILHTCSSVSLLLGFGSYYLAQGFLIEFYCQGLFPSSAFAGFFCWIDYIIWKASCLCSDYMWLFFRLVSVLSTTTSMRGSSLFLCASDFLIWLYIYNTPPRLKFWKLISTNSTATLGFGTPQLLIYLNCQFCPLKDSTLYEGSLLTAPS